MSDRDAKRKKYCVLIQARNFSYGVSLEPFPLGPFPRLFIDLYHEVIILNLFSTD